MSGFLFLCRIDVEGCRSVSLPTEATNLNVQQHLYKKIENGEYKIRQLIVLQEFKKSIIKNDKVLTEKVVITGRKIPLSTIRYDLFKKHEKYMHLIKDSDISAHSHLLMMISYLYDQACHLTDTEFKERHGVDINVQSMVEN